MREELASQLSRYLREVVEPAAGLMATGHGADPREVVAQAGAHGLAGLLIPPEFGGSGCSYVEFAQVIEQVASVCASTAVILDVHASVAVHPLIHYGSAAQKSEWLPRLASGEMVGAFALTEPGAGSDAASATTAAHPSTHGWSITGAKLFITNCGAADLYLVIARTGGPGASGLSAFLVERADRGVAPGRRLEKMGLHGSWTGELLLQEVAVTPSRLLGGLGEGFRIAMEALDVGRIGIAAQAVGIARGALALVGDREGQRSVEGERAGSSSAVPAHVVADMVTSTEAAWQLAVSAARAADRRAPSTFLASAAKLVATDNAMHVTEGVLDLLGLAAGFGDHPAAVRFCDAKACQIYEGTNQIQRIVIARELSSGVTGRSDRGR